MVFKPMHVMRVGGAFTRPVGTAKIPNAIQAKNELKKLSHQSIDTNSFESIITPFLKKKAAFNHFIYQAPISD